MIIYGLLKCVLFILGLLASVLGSLIPSLPTSVSGLLQSVVTIFDGGITFISYFFYWEAIVGLISLIIAYHGFQVVKSAIMKVIGHFIGD